MLESAPSHQLADIISALVNASFKEKVDVLNAVDLKERFVKALPLLIRQIEGLEMLQDEKMKNIKSKIRPRVLEPAKYENDNDLDEADELQDLEIKLRSAPVCSLLFTGRFHFHFLIP